RRDPHLAGPVDVAGVVPHEHVGPPGPQLLQDGTLRDVGAADGDALREEHLGQCTHPGAADADEVDSSPWCLHAATSLSRAARGAVHNLGEGEAFTCTGLTRLPAAAPRRPSPTSAWRAPLLPESCPGSRRRRP